MLREHSVQNETFIYRIGDFLRAHVILDAALILC
jgi:hypothetical protein